MLKRLLVGVSFLMLGAFGLQAQSSSTQQQYDTQTTQSGSSQMSMTDQDFVREAYQSNLNEIELGRMAAQKSSHSEVKQFAQKMVDDHSAANNELKRIASNKGIDFPSSASIQDKNNFSNLSGSEFDQQYMQHQVQAHQDAKSLFRNWASNGQDPELKSFASNQLSKIQNHEQMASSLHSRITSSSSTAGRSDLGSDTDSGQQLGRSEYEARSGTDSTTTTQRTDETSRDEGVPEDQNLPRTASNLPLIGLVGLMLLTAALITRSFRSLRNNR